MEVRSLDPPRTRSHRWMKSGMLVACALCAFALLFASACGGDDSGSSTATTTGAESTTATAQAAEMTPDEIGAAVGATWADAMQELVALLESKPESSAIKSQVEQLKERYVVKLVALGRLREALSDSDKARVSAGITKALDASADEPWFTSYMDIYDGYSDGDLDFANLLASFNILTQYADFDLLKQQAPEEAARLGIE
jgi:hypothetical protein